MERDEREVEGNGGLEWDFFLIEPGFSVVARLFWEIRANSFDQQFVTFRIKMQFVRQ